VIPAPPDGATPARPDRPVVPAPPPRRGPKGAPAVTWRWPAVAAVWLLGNLVIGQIVAVGIVMAVLGFDDIEQLTEGSLGITLSIMVDLIFVATMVVWLVRWHPGWVAALGLPRAGTWVKTVLAGAGWGVLLYPAIAIVVALPLQALFSLVSDAPVNTPEQVPSDLSAAGKLAAVVLAIVIAPPVEELFYRGLLFRAIRDRRGFWAGASVSALVFGVVHFVPAPWQETVLLQAIMVFTGFALAWLYERSGTIVTTIVAHMVFNTIGITFILSSG